MIYTGLIEIKYPIENTDTLISLGLFEVKQIKRTVKNLKANGVKGLKLSLWKG